MNVAPCDLEYLVSVSLKKFCMMKIEKSQFLPPFGQLKKTAESGDACITNLNYGKGVLRYMICKLSYVMWYKTPKNLYSKLYFLAHHGEPKKKWCSFFFT